MTNTKRSGSKDRPGVRCADRPRGDAYMRGGMSAMATCAYGARVWRLLTLGLLVVAAVRPLAAQAPGWQGWARCEVDVQGQGYTDHQTHTWQLSGGAPTVEGAFRIYGGTWSVIGRGSLQRTTGNQTLVAEWSTNAQNSSAPLALFVRASDGRMFIQARHAQLRAAASVAGYQQVTIDGQRQRPVPIASEAFEWTFPTVEGASTVAT